jgi:hypothetical protein
MLLLIAGQEFRRSSIPRCNQEEPRGPEENGSPAGTAGDAVGEAMAVTPDLVATVCER